MSLLITAQFVSVGFEAAYKSQMLQCTANGKTK